MIRLPLATELTVTFGVPSAVVRKFVAAFVTAVEFPETAVDQSPDTVVWRVMAVAFPAMVGPGVGTAVVGTAVVGAAVVGVAVVGGLDVGGTLVAET